MRIMIVVLTAFVVATIGVIRLLAPDSSSAATNQATADSVTASVTAAVWTTMDHDMSGDAPGYQMPPAMMPGMPENGDQRFAISVTVVNTSGDTRPLRPGKEFALHDGKESKQWAPHSDTFGDQPRLAPHNAVKGVLFFDLSPAELAGSRAWLEWTHGDTANRLIIPTDGVSTPPSHPHTH